MKNRVTLTKRSSLWPLKISDQVGFGDSLKVPCSDLKRDKRGHSCVHDFTEGQPEPRWTRVGQDRPVFSPGI